MSSQPKIIVPTAPLAADAGYCERCEEDTGTRMYDDRLLCDKCYDDLTIGEPYEDYRAEFEQWLDEDDDDYVEDQRLD